MKTIVKRLGGFAVVAVLWSGSALWPSTAAAQPDAQRWTGFYIGANVGGVVKRQSNSLSIENDPNNYFQPAVVPEVEHNGSVDLNDSGFTGGVQVGYNRQHGGLVWGVELDFNGLDLSNRRSGTFRYSTNNAPYSLTVQESTDWLMTVRPRVGWALDRFLLYFTVGLAVAHSEFKQSFEEPPFTPDPVTVSTSKTQVGWTIGTGLEFAFARNWSARAEYLYARFGETDVVGRLGGADGASGAAGSVDGAKFTNTLGPLELHLFRAAVNFHFR